jgi:excisionase family DNA binding protein
MNTSDMSRGTPKSIVTRRGRPADCENTVLDLAPVLRIEQRLLTVKQAAQYLGRSEASVQHLIAKGTLRTFRADRRVQLDVQDLDRWIADHKHKGI